MSKPLNLKKNCIWDTFINTVWIVLILSILICNNVVLYWRPRRDLVYMYHELFIWLYKWASCDCNKLTGSSAGSYVYCIMMYTLPSLARENVNVFLYHFRRHVLSNVAPRSRCMEKPMDRTDFHRVEQELQQKLHPLPVLQTQSLQCAQGWSTASLGVAACYMLALEKLICNWMLSNNTTNGM